MKNKKSYLNCGEHDRSVFNEFLLVDKDHPYPCRFERFKFGLVTFPGIGECLYAVGLREGKRYDPFDQLAESKISDAPTPYNEFANLKETPESLLDYANRRGLPETLSEMWADSIRSTIVQVEPPPEELDRLDFKGTPEDLLEKGKTNILYPLDCFRMDILNMRRVLDLKGDNEVLNGKDGESRGRGLCLAVTKEIEDTRVSLTITSNGLKKTYRVRTIKEALYITLLEDLTLQTRQCADPKCGKYFTVDHKGKIFCTTACAHRTSCRRAYQPKKKKGRS